MADKIYAKVVVCEEAFERWWREHQAEFLVRPHNIGIDGLANAAWRAGWDVAWAKAWEAAVAAREVDAIIDNGFNTMVGVTEGEAPLPGPVVKVSRGRATRPEDLHEDPNVDKQADWNKLGTEIREAEKLAKRLGLTITTATQGKKNEVQALWSGNVIAEAGSLAEMIETLKRMEKEGKL